MQKLILGFLVAVLATFGLVDLAATDANAATHCPYTGCVATVTVIKAPATIVQGGLLPIKVIVSPLAGAASPRGIIDASCSRPHRTKSKERHYRGQSRFVFFKLRKAATWKCTVDFHSAHKFKRSSDSSTVVVTRH